MKNIIRIFVNTPNDLEVWDIDKSFTNDIRQIIGDRRDGMISQEDEYLKIYKILKRHGKCIAKDVDFGINIKESDEDKKEHTTCKEHDEIIVRIVDKYRKT